MRWDYRCPRCGLGEERDASVTLRDRQECRCGATMERLQAFASQHVQVPPSMRAAHDERTYIPSDAAGREKFLTDAYRHHGKWRTDLEVRPRQEAMREAERRFSEEMLAKLPGRPVKPTRKLVEEALVETKRKFRVN